VHFFHGQGVEDQGHDDGRNDGQESREQPDLPLGHFHGAFEHQIFLVLTAEHRNVAPAGENRLYGVQIGIRR
jgi:hypothetical protein